MTAPGYPRANRTAASVVCRGVQRAALVSLLLAACGGPATSSQTAHAVASEGPDWSEWSEEAFQRARREDKPIMLSVQAGWCHWCHVMNDTTYRDPEVLRELAEHFVLIRADGDARPDLADRYQRYAWPATVFLSPEGEQILGLRGYRPPERFRGILADVLSAHAEDRTLDDDAGGGEAPAEDLDAVRIALLAQLDGMYDEEAGGWGRRQRYPFAAPVEHAFFRAAVRGESQWRERALDSLAQYARLIDPVFGGMYQYSVPDVWDRPHFEKIVSVQAGAMRAFGEAYRATGDEHWLGHAFDVHRYVEQFLRAEDGAFYTAQDADLGGHGQPGPHVPGDEYYALDEEGRRALGVPRIDTHVYASNNGLLIEALADLYVASGRRAPLSQALTAGERILRTHRAQSGLFRHDAESDDPLFYLEDQAHVLAAWLALHEATGQARWEEEAQRLADAMLEHLQDEQGGFHAHTEDPRAAGFFADRRVPIEENGVAARALLTLSRLKDEARYRDAAVAALRASARPGELRSLGRMVGEYLLALEALDAGYVLLSVVGPDDPRTTALHRAAVDLYEPTRLVELGRPGASRYPYPGEPAVFLCTSEACSMPVTDPSELRESALSFLGRD